MSFKAQHAKSTDARAERREAPLDQIASVVQPEPSLAGTPAPTCPVLIHTLSPVLTVIFHCIPLRSMMSLTARSHPTARHPCPADQGQGEAGQVDRRAQAQEQGDREGHGARPEARQAQAER
jgi:hypothetical protein